MKPMPVDSRCWKCNVEIEAKALGVCTACRAKESDAIAARKALPVGGTSCPEEFALQPCAGTALTIREVKGFNRTAVNRMVVRKPEIYEPDTEEQRT